MAGGPSSERDVSVKFGWPICTMYGPRDPDKNTGHRWEIVQMSKLCVEVVMGCRLQLWIRRRWLPIGIGIGVTCLVIGTALPVPNHWM